LKAIGYCVEKKGFFSFAEQQKLFDQFCINEGFEPAAIFFDRTPNVDDNPGFGQLINFLKTNNSMFLVVVVADNKVLGKDPAEMLLKITQIEMEGKKVVLAKTGGPALQALIRKRKPEKIKHHLAQMQKPKFGFRIGAKMRFLINKQEAQIVKLIYKLYLEDNLGMHSIAKHLNNDQTAKSLRFWDKQKVRRILTDSIYAGENNGLKIFPIVSDEEFSKAQEKRSSLKGKGQSSKKYEYKLSGLIYCGECGGKFIGHSRKQKWKLKSGEYHENQYHKYVCANRTKGQECRIASVHETKLLKEIQSILQEGRAQARLIDTNDYDTWKIRMRKKIAQLESQRSKNRTKIKDLIKQAKLKKIELSKFQELAKEHTEIEKFFQDTAFEAKQSLLKTQTTLVRTQELQDLRTELLQKWDHLDEREIHQLLNKTVESIIINNEKVEVFFRA
tara:strand:- start:16712 stop:18046 length:1335 start_codon:yes stop_codon:yes gene_type:complete